MLYMRETLRGVKRGPFSLFCLALGGFWCWNWVVFQSPTSLTILVEGWDVALPSRAISLLAFALTACALYAARRRSHLPQGKARIRGRWAVVAVGVGAIVACNVVGGSFDGVVDESLPALVAGVCFGVVGSLLYMEWAAAVADVGIARFRLMICACILSSLVGSLLAALLFYVSDTLRQVLVLAFLLASFPLLDHFSSAVLFGGAAEGSFRPVQSDAGIPKKFVATLFVLGASLGLMQGIFTLTNTLSALGPLSSAGIALAAALVFVAVFVLDLDFNRLLYQLGLPLIAFGFVLMVISGSGFWGYLLSVTGYRFGEIVVWVLCVYLAARIKDSVSFLVPAMACALPFGQSIGLLVFDGRLEPWTMQVSVVAATVLFMSAIVLVTGKDEKKSWGLAAPGERPQAGLIDEAVDSVAVDALFTAREAEVFALLVQGKTKRSISRELVLSENTVKTHIGKIYRKLGIHSQQELIDFVEQRAAVAHADTVLESFGEA